MRASLVVTLAGSVLLAGGTVQAQIAGVRETAPAPGTISRPAPKEALRPKPNPKNLGERRTVTSDEPPQRIRTGSIKRLQQKPLIRRGKKTVPEKTNLTT